VRHLTVRMWMCSGQSFSKDMAPLNGAPCCGQMVNKEQSQISATQLHDGRIVAMLRPGWASRGESVIKCPPRSKHSKNSYNRIYL
jgi:hypothetical protein